MEKPQEVTQQEPKSGTLNVPGVSLPPALPVQTPPQRRTIVAPPPAPSPVIDDTQVSPEARKSADRMTIFTIFIAAAGLIGIFFLAKRCNSEIKAPAGLVKEVATLKKDVASLRSSDNTILTNITNVEKKVDDVAAKSGDALGKLLDRIEGLETNKADKTELGSYAKAKRLKRVEDRLNRHLADVANNGGETEKPTPSPVATVPPAPAAPTHKVTYQPKPYVVPVYKFK